MSKIAASLVGLLLSPAIALAQQQTELNVGWLNYSAGTISQDLRALPRITTTLRRHEAFVTSIYAMTATHLFLDGP
jgi:hypothetical protein